MANTIVYKPQGGAEIVVGAGGKLTVEAGATIDAKAGATVTGFGNAANPYVLPAATAEALGGVIVTGEYGIGVEDGVIGCGVGNALTYDEHGALAVVPAAAVEDCAAEDVAGCVTSINAIISALKTAGLMAAAAAGTGTVSE